MDIQQLISLWDEFEEAEKPARRVLDDENGKPQYFKGQFADFIRWLKIKSKSNPLL